MTAKSDEPSLENALESARGKVCSQVIACDATGSNLLLGFRDGPRPGDRNGEPSKGIQLFLEDASWRLCRGPRILATAPDLWAEPDRDDERRGRLLGRTVVEMTLSLPCHDLRVELDEGYVLDVFCDSSTDGDCLWHIASASGSWGVESDGSTFRVCYQPD